ncbi:NAD(P)-binding domain-containing protein [Paenibacillus sp. BSR1-1]|uniref:NAD(P)-binding domain-containing protein n=1 Tax=Paenibacillus sp. BSR1-1 TaxID=3020845 RepID=UPI0025AF0220|nr:NAD(P)-binding domain-containing protein [Paenibacillus sp. BSR1-1]MDN3016365.1 NAD(P)-binding domain-containing protein [Paenibacillus sp. BSR1-1]
MKPMKAGLVGIGKLGTAMMAHWHRSSSPIGIYHPVKKKAEDFVQQFQNGYCLSKEELSNLDVLVLALPALRVIPFISSIRIKGSTTIINMATALQTNEIKSNFPSLNIQGVKFMGHWKDLLEHGNGLFITESPLPPEIEDLYHSLGKVKLDREDCLSEVNKLATYYAIKAAIEIEKDFSDRGISPEYVKRALTSLAPEVMRSYSEGNLGHFAMDIVKEVQAEKGGVNLD